jgi:hypothetical protein
MIDLSTGRVQRAAAAGEPFAESVTIATIHGSALRGAALAVISYAHAC